MVGSARKREHENKTEKKKPFSNYALIFRVSFTYASSLLSESLGQARQ